MHMLLLQLDYFCFLGNVCLLNCDFSYELLCMKLYESYWMRVVGLTHTLKWGLFHILACDVIPLMCSFQVVYYYRILRGALPFPFCVLESPCIALELPQGHTLSLTQIYHTYLCVLPLQGITLPPTARTPTPNGLRFSWDFLSGR